MAKSKKKDDSKSLEQKWGESTMSRGWTGVPNTLIERQQALGLNPTEVNIILILMKYWWDKNAPPFPSKRAISEMIGRDESTIRKCMASLEKKGLIKRGPQYLSMGGQTSNKYIMDGLIQKLEQESNHLNKLKQERIEEDAKIRRGYEIN